MADSEELPFVAHTSTTVPGSNFVPRRNYDIDLRHGFRLAPVLIMLQGYLMPMEPVGSLYQGSGLPYE